MQELLAQGARQPEEIQFASAPINVAIRFGFPGIAKLLAAAHPGFLTSDLPDSRAERRDDCKS